MDDQEMPRLVTATGYPMNVYGIKFVRYASPKDRWVVMRYLVWDAPYQIVSVAGLCSFGHSMNFRYHKTALMWRNHHGAGVATYRGTKYHGEPNHIPEDCSLPARALRDKRVSQD